MKKALGQKEKTKRNYAKTELEQLRVSHFDYQFCIISKATDVDPSNNIVFRELLNVRENNKLNGAIDIKCFYEIFNSRSMFIFAVRFSQEVINYYVDHLDFTIYNIQRKYHCPFIAARYSEYEPIKDYYARNIIMLAITQEFNLSNFQAEGLIADAFNLHEFKELENIRLNWKEDWRKFLSNPITLEPSTRGVTFLSGIAHYNGCQVGLLLAFMTHVISSLLVPLCCSAAMVVLRIVVSFDSTVR